MKRHCVSTAEGVYRAHRRAAGWWEAVECCSVLPGAARTDFPVVATSLQHVSPRPLLRPPPHHQHTAAYMNNVGPKTTNIRLRGPTKHLCKAHLRTVTVGILKAKQVGQLIFLFIRVLFLHM